MRGSERNSWMTEDAMTESDEGMTPSTISTGDFVFVGDMVFEKKSLADESSEEEGVQKSVIKNMSRIWPNKQMPIKFHSSVGRRARRAVQTAINTLEGETCISFPKYDPNLHKNYMTIKSTEEGYKAFVGFKENQNHNQINLESGDSFCESSPSAIHEIMHSLGVYHEQNRYDRDEYIEVLFDNLMPDTVSQYYKQSRADLETYGEPYDYGSIMHYEVRAGTKDGLPGFRVLRPYNEDAIGHAKVPSRIDLRLECKKYIFGKAFIATMLQSLLIFIIFALPVSINFVKGGSLRSKSGSERNSWITEDAITEDESTGSDDELTLSDLFSDDDFDFVGDMIIEKKKLDDDESSEEEGVQKSVVKNMSR
uniref:Metalloendopeptidase n=1 Tax=Meloidogyne javanica TaxID=6303 RepID=A0A915LID0_MELJA